MTAPDLDALERAAQEAIGRPGVLHVDHAAMTMICRGVPVIIARLREAERQWDEARAALGTCEWEKESALRYVDRLKTRVGHYEHALSRSVLLPPPAGSETGGA